MKEQMLTFEDCLSAFYKWARYYQGTRWEFWELINEAWMRSDIESLRRSEIKLASIIIRRKMLDYMRDDTKYRHYQRAKASGRPYPKMYNFSAINENMGRDELSRGIEDILENTRADTVDVEQKDSVNYLINNSGLTRRERLVVKLYYIAGLTEEEVGKAIGISDSRISQILTLAVETMKSNRAISNYEMEE